MKSSHHSVTVFAGALLLLPAVCLAQQPDAHQQYKQTLNQLAPQIQQQTMTALNDALKAAGSGGGPVTDVSALQALLPESVDDLKRIHVSGKKGGTEGIMQMSSAEATYADEDRVKTLSIRFNDMGGIPGVASAIEGMGASEAEAEEQLIEDENGYTRMSKIDGFPAVEVYNNKSKQGTLTITAGKRIVITVAGSNVSADIFAKTSDELDLQALSELAP